jgi:RNA polymerase sigma-70 factor (ECF subfamily)
MQANNRRLYRIARGILRHVGEAEDAVQAACIRAFTPLNEFRRAPALATGPARIAMNVALGRFGDNARPWIGQH